MTSQLSPSGHRDALPIVIEPVSPGAINRTQLALFAGGSGDHNPIHIDIDIAWAHGFDDVIVHGMLLMAQLSKVLTDWAGPSSIRQWNVRFISVTPVLGVPTYYAEVIKETEFSGEPCMRVALRAEVEGVGEVLRGEAFIAK